MKTVEVLIQDNTVPSLRNKKGVTTIERQSKKIESSRVHSSEWKCRGSLYKDHDIV